MYSWGRRKKATAHHNGEVKVTQNQKWWVKAHNNEEHLYNSESQPENGAPHTRGLLPPHLDRNVQRPIS